MRLTKDSTRKAKLSFNELLKAKERKQIEAWLRSEMLICNCHLVTGKFNFRVKLYCKILSGHLLHIFAPLIYLTARCHSFARCSQTTHHIARKHFLISYILTRCQVYYVSPQPPMEPELWANWKDFSDLQNFPRQNNISKKLMPKRTALNMVVTCCCLLMNDLNIKVKY